MDIQLINKLGNWYSYKLLAHATAIPKVTPSFNRIVYSAAHVVSNPLATADPWRRIAGHLRRVLGSSAFAQGP